MSFFIYPALSFLHPEFITVEPVIQAVGCQCTGDIQLEHGREMRREHGGEMLRKHGGEMRREHGGEMRLEHGGDQ